MTKGPKWGVERVQPPPEIQQMGLEQRPHTRKLEDGWIRVKLIWDLATGEIPMAAMMEKYNCSKQAIHKFRDRHALEIDEAKGQLADRFAGNWIADKRNRIAEYEAAFERIRDILDRSDPDKSSVPLAEMIRTQMQALRSVAEELGDLTQKVDVRMV